MLIRSKVKYIQSLSHKKQRDEDGVFVAEGVKMIYELLESGVTELIELFAVKDTKGSFGLADPGKISWIDSSELERISFLMSPNQVLGIFKKPVHGEAIFTGTVTLMLDNIQDPGNLGSIVRCADWFGITQIICSSNCADVYSPKTVQSTMGSITRVKISYQNLPEKLSMNNVMVYGATLDGKNLYEQDKLIEGIIVIGNESKGISKEVMKFVNTEITIPRKGSAESLNAAVATGIILSHLISQ